MYTSQPRTAPSPLQRLPAWIAARELRRALALSVLIGAVITVASWLGRVPSPAHAADTPPVVTRYVDVVPETPSGWAADESATGTAPDRAH